MKYMGSKARIAKHILPIILKDRKDGQWYVEPFVGGANIIDKVGGNRIGSDSNAAVIDALEFIRDSKTPQCNKEFTEGDYEIAAKKARNAEYLSPVECFALFAYSFGAKWVGGWGRGKNSNGEDRDYVAEQHRAAETQRDKINGIDFFSCNYFDLKIPQGSTIYCDPPYAGTTKYRDDFDHDKFWQWCRDKAMDGHRVFISEYKAPDDFVCVWSKELAVTVARSGERKIGTERLFIHKSQT